MADTLILPTEIPWDTLTGKDLEELLYWLLDSMGAKELEWRIGGAGSGSPDQGRDLELSFYIPTPDGGLIKQRWWVEAKGRSRTVEPSEVKNAVINAAGNTYVDTIVIATNSTYSNGTRDWIKEWNTSHIRPSVKLWERTELENFCSKNPVAVVRLFSKALNLQGQLEVTKAKLWDYSSYTGRTILERIWAEKHCLSIDARSLMALIASEMANGDISIRSWGMFVDKELIACTLGDSLLNFIFLLMRAHEAGSNQKPLLSSFSYLLLICIFRLGADSTNDIITQATKSSFWSQHPKAFDSVIMKDIVQILNDELADVCSNGCCRIRSDPSALTKDEIACYWDRLKVNTENVCKSHDDETLIMEFFENPCKIGLKLDNHVHCPLFFNENVEDNIAGMIQKFETIIDKYKNDG